MVAATAITDLFSQFGGSAKTKLLIHDSLGVSFAPLVDRLRSLNIEHVSPSDLIRQEISRRTPFGITAERRTRSGLAVSDEAILSLMKRWFWARKLDAGFSLSGFPATLLQALVFDEWLDARGELLNGVIAAVNAHSDTLIDHYRTLGLLLQTEPSLLS